MKIDWNDFLMGIDCKMATGLGFVIYLINRFFIGGAILEVAGIALFVVGLYRWNKELRAKTKINK